GLTALPHPQTPALAAVSGPWETDRAQRCLGKEAIHSPGDTWKPSDPFRYCERKKKRRATWGAVLGVGEQALPDTCTPPPGHVLSQFEFRTPRSRQLKGPAEPT
ncbi:hypothetical protein GOODEAATRI_024533, partial [Goodea atripinnis]